MIKGTVNARQEAVVDLTVSGPGGREERVAFVVDTGSNGGLTLPAATVAALELRSIGVEHAFLADGSRTVFEVCEAMLTWGGTPRRVVVDIAETEPLLGMAVLQGHELCIEAVLGGQVHITPLP